MNVYQIHKSNYSITTDNILKNTTIYLLATFEQWPHIAFIRKLNVVNV